MNSNHKRVLGGISLTLVLLAPLKVTAGPVADAASNGDLNTLRQLIQAGSDVNEPQADGTTALHWAAQANDVGMAKLLIDAGATVDVRNRVGAPPILAAAINGSAEMLELLLQAGAAPVSSPRCRPCSTTTPTSTRRKVGAIPRR